MNALDDDGSRRGWPKVGESEIHPAGVEITFDSL